MQRTLIQNGVVFTWETKYMHAINIRFKRQAFPYIHNFILIQLMLSENEKQNDTVKTITLKFFNITDQENSLKKAHIFL